MVTPLKGVSLFGTRWAVIPLDARAILSALDRRDEVTNEVALRALLSRERLPW